MGVSYLEFRNRISSKAESRGNDINTLGRVPEPGRSSLALIEYLNFQHTKKKREKGLVGLTKFLVNLTRSLDRSYPTKPFFLIEYMYLYFMLKI